jgi:hypothetical protein
MAAEGKKRFNLHLSQENAEILREHLKGSGMTLSNYVDVLIGLTVDNLKKAGIKPGDRMDVSQFFELFRIDELQIDHSDKALEDLMDRDPELALKLIKEYKLGFSERYYERKKREREQKKE